MSHLGPAFSSISCCTTQIEFSNLCILSHGQYCIVLEGRGEGDIDIGAVCSSFWALFSYKQENVYFAGERRMLGECIFLLALMGALYISMPIARGTKTSIFPDSGFLREYTSRDI